MSSPKSFSPIHLYTPDPGDPHAIEGGWYFWDETWSDRIGPFETEEQAKEACRKYGESL